jgi:hypothetical protein
VANINTHESVAWYSAARSNHSGGFLLIVAVGRTQTN